MGWFKLWRKILENKLFKSLPSADHRLVMIMIISEANFTDGTDFCRKCGKEIICPRGTIWRTQEYLAEISGTTRGIVRSTLKRLQEGQDPFMKKTFSCHNVTLFEICNYAKYQDYDDSLTATQPLLNQHSTATQPLLNPDIRSKEVKKIRSKETTTSLREEYFDLADLLREQILITKPDHRLSQNEYYEKSAKKQWADIFRKLVEIDKRSIEEIKRVIVWCQQDEFWSINMQSAATLRKQYDKLTLKMKTPFYSKNDRPQLIARHDDKRWLDVEDVSKW